ncbi:MAG TPA: Fe-S cluster assembly protein SufD [Steroidobacteraceae bacterium]|nr:Fe-S cluster assembly protein SufD [Steroidobacteraceae bacterium]
MSALEHAGGSAALRSFEAQWLARAPDRLSSVRERALRRFLELGMPTMRDESWRYTNLRPLAARSFVDAPRVAAPGVAAPGVAAPGIAALEHPERLGLEAERTLLGAGGAAATILLVNGHPLVPGAPLAPAPGLEVSTLADLSRQDPDLLARRLEPLSDAEELRWLLLNTALATDGLHLRIDGALRAPLLLLHVGTAARPDTAAYPRVILEAAPGAAATVIEQHIQVGAEAPLSNSATLLELGRDARIEHYRVFAAGENAVHLDTLQVRQQQGSECRQFTAILGGGLVRATLEARLIGRAARLESYSLLAGHADRHVDCVNLVEHAAPCTESRQTARAIASGTSRVIFNSKVVVDAGASQADSRQSCRGLLLSAAAEIDSRPQLEIHTDEVKCAHGATTGRLDPNMLFYMLSRGLDRGTAQSLLVYAFLADVLTGMGAAGARASIEDALIAQLPDSQTLQKFR